MRTNYPPATGDHALDRALRFNHDNVIELMNNQRKFQNDLVAAQASFNQQLAALKAATAAATPTTGKKPKQSIQSMIGTAAEPQPAGVPFFTSNPPVTHPVTQQTQLILVGPTPSSPTSVLKYADPTTDPPQWIPLTTGGGGGGGSAVSSITATASTSSTAELNLAALALSAGQLNAVGKRMRTTAFGRMNLTIGGGGGLTVTWSLYISPHPTSNPPSLATARFIGSWQITTSAGAAGFNNIGWDIKTEWVTTTAGVSGVFTAGGPLLIDSPFTIAAVGPVVTSTSFVFANTPIDLTQQYDIVWTSRFSNAGQTMFIDHASVEVLN